VVLLTPQVTLVVHPVDTQAHPTVPTGWRWAVVVGGRPPSDVKHTANAGWAPDERTALLEGEQNAATAVRALRLFGVAVTAGTLTLDHDPIPPGHDQIHLA
jgi:hypothetical protein